MTIKSMEDHVEIKPSTIKGAGMGVFATKDIGKFVILDEYKGEWVKPKDYWRKSSKSVYVWTLEDTEGEPIGYIDGVDPAKSNWLRYVNCPMTKDQENVRGIQQGYKIIYYTLRKIKAGEELFVYYGDEYYEILTGKKSIE